MIAGNLLGPGTAEIVEGPGVEVGDLVKEGFEWLHQINLGNLFIVIVRTKVMIRSLGWPCRGLSRRGH
jgi:hypothetical protein